jgi:hypothetical protein
VVAARGEIGGEGAERLERVRKLFGINEAGAAMFRQAS